MLISLLWWRWVEFCILWGDCTSHIHFGTHLTPHTLCRPRFLISRLQVAGCWPQLPWCLEKERISHGPPSVTTVSICLPLSSLSLPLFFVVIDWSYIPIPRRHIVRERAEWDAVWSVANHGRTGIINNNNFADFQSSLLFKIYIFTYSLHVQLAVGAAAWHATLGPHWAASVMASGCQGWQSKTNIRHHTVQPTSPLYVMRIHHPCLAALFCDAKRWDQARRAP